jgi:hypothetical protein
MTMHLHLFRRQEMKKKALPAKMDQKIKIDRLKG